MGQLTITFSGICTHFYRCIPSGVGDAMIPLRSVLPNALGIHFGMFQFPVLSGPPLQPMYYLMPHIAVVADAKTPPATQSSYLYGARLEVLNPDPLQGAFEFDSTLADGCHLPHYVDPDLGIKPSPDVVQNYNAACYVDFLYGKGRVVLNGSSKTTVITVDTLDDPPKVRITPFPLPNSLMPTQPDWTVTSGNLYVTNQDFDAAAEDKPFDFMLNYLTTFPGIPRFLKENLPGMTDPLTQLTPPLLAESMSELTTAILQLGDQFPFPGKEMTSFVEFLASRVLIGQAVDLDESCSDSHYP